MELTLTSAEGTVLHETMDAAVSDLLLEIARTDNRKMRDLLKEREKVMQGILAKLAIAERAA